MSDNRLKIRVPVVRKGAQNDLLLSLVSFGGSVILTRFFLELTGYPRLGNGELHIAHVLWGGLILFAAALIPLIYANPWAFTLSAFLSGIGVGLFIDEVGKFITMNNDYFYPPAAPIIYAIFLLTVLIYLRVRKTPNWNSRREFYYVLDGLKEVLDRDLEQGEQSELRGKLIRIAEIEKGEDLGHLAGQLAEFLASEQIYIAPDRTTYMRKILTSARAIENKYLHRERLRLIIAVALSFLGVVALVEVLNTFASTSGFSFNLEILIRGGMTRGEIRSAIGVVWFFIHITLQTIIALLAILSAGLLASRWEKWGIELGMVVVVISLTMVNLLSFCITQFSAAVDALIQLLIFLALMHYRRRYLG